MEELQSWWEVPTIAHFCHVFQAAFNLLHFEIEELESALLQNDEHLFCATIEQLIMRLLQGCYKKESVSSENWEQLLHKLLQNKVSKVRNKENCDDIKPPFNLLTIREKVDILFKLCELRLDVADVFDITKNIDSDELRIEPVGIDHKNNVYWYFFGFRLYKEGPSKVINTPNKAKKIEQNPQTNSRSRRANRGKGRNSSTNKNTQIKEEEEEISSVSNEWSIVCHSLEDWKNLIKILKKNAHNKQLAMTLEDKYLPIVSECAMKREKLERKRLLELAPRRTSSRIEKVRQQRELEMIEEEQARLEKLKKERKRQLWEEENRQRIDREERAKSFVEKRKAVEDRATRAKLREIRLFSERAESRRISDSLT